MRLLRICGLALATLLVLTAATAYAQIPSGVIDGTALDPDGQPLPGVTVTVTGSALMAPRVVYTGPTGGFRVAALPPTSLSIHLGMNSGLGKKVNVFCPAQM